MSIGVIPGHQSTMSLGVIQDIIPGWNSRLPFKPWLRQANPSEEKRGVTVGGWQLLREIGIHDPMCHSNEELALPEGYKMWNYGLNSYLSAGRNNTHGTIQRISSSLLDIGGGLEEERDWESSSKTWSENQRKMDASWLIDCIVSPAAPARAGPQKKKEVKSLRPRIL